MKLTNYIIELATVFYDKIVADSWSIALSSENPTTQFILLTLFSFIGMFDITKRTHIKLSKVCVYIASDNQVFQKL
jgi:hypothetical protein